MSMRGCVYIDIWESIRGNRELSKMTAFLSVAFSANSEKILAAMPPESLNSTPKFTSYQILVFALQPPGYLESDSINSFKLEA